MHNEEFGKVTTFLEVVSLCSSSGPAQTSTPFFTAGLAAVVDVTLVFGVGRAIGDGITG